MSNDVTNFAASLVEMAKAMERVPELERQLANEIDLSTKELLRNSDLQVSLEASRRYAASLEQRCHDLEVSRDAAELRFLEADDVVSTIKSVLRRTMEDADSALKAIEPVVEPVAVAEPQATSEPLKEGEVWATSAIGAITNTGWHKVEPTPVAELVSGSITATELSMNEPDQGSMYELVREQAPLSPFPDTTPSTVQSPEDGMGKTIDQPQCNELPVSKSEVPFASTSTPPNPVHPSPVTTSDVGSSQTEAADAKPIGPYFGLKYISVPRYMTLTEWLNGGGLEADYHWRP
jgi:hypothetical protein